MRRVCTGARYTMSKQSGERHLTGPTLVDSWLRSHGNTGAGQQGLTLVHFSAQRKHVLWDTLCLWAGSMTRNGSGRAEMWTSVSPCGAGIRPQCQLRKNVLRAGSTRAGLTVCSQSTGGCRTRWPDCLLTSYRWLHNLSGFSDRTAATTANISYSLHSHHSHHSHHRNCILRPPRRHQPQSTTQFGARLTPVLCTNKGLGERSRLVSDSREG